MLPFATRGTDLQGMRLSERDQRKTQGIPQGTLEGIPCMCNPKKYCKLVTIPRKEAESQGMFPTQGSNLGLLHGREILYH